MDTFKDENECLELFFSIKYAGCACRKCGRPVVSNYAKKKGERGFRCRSCHEMLYPFTDTIFRKSLLPVSIIFFAIFSLTGSRSSIAATQIGRDFGISYKSAHRLMMLLRSVLGQQTALKLKGTVEVDEAFFGKGSKMYNWSAISTRKQPIIGMLERETRKVRMFLVANRNSKTIHELIRNNVEEGSTVYTDSWRGYRNLSEYYKHDIVDHSNREYVRGEVHTNGIESVWSHMKRNIRGAHIKISDRYVHLYAMEACWRHNSRGKPPMQLFNDILLRTMFFYPD